MSFFSRLRAMFGQGSGDEDGEPAPTLQLKRPPRRKRAADDVVPRFRTTATDRSDTGGQDEVRMRLREAFLPSQPVSSKAMFAGRLPLLSQLIEAVEDQRAHVVLYGERGIGKTSLLKIFTEIAGDAGYLVVNESCGGATVFDELMGNVAQQIPLIYYGALAPTEVQQDQGASLAGVIPPGASGPGAFSRVLSAIAGTRVIVVLDEFDRAESDSFERHVAELIKNLSDASARVQFVIAGVAKNLQDLLGYSPSIRRNVVDIPVGQMSEPEVEELIALGEQHAGLSFDPAARKEIVELASGRPYLARLICHHASLAAVNAKHDAVTEADVEGAVERAVNEIESRLPEQTKNAATAWLSSDPQQILAIARASLLNGGEFGEGDILALEPQSAGKSGALLKRLAASGELVTTSNDPGERRYRFAEEGLASFLLLAATRPTVTPPPAPVAGSEVKP